MRIYCKSIITNDTSKFLWPSFASLAWIQKFLSAPSFSLILFAITIAYTTQGTQREQLQKSITIKTKYYVQLNFN